MNGQNVFDRYIEAVCSKVAWRRAHPMIRRELQDHMEDQKEAFLAAGMSEAEAETETVRSMGAAEQIGMEFQKVYQPRFHEGMLLISAGLLVLAIFIRITVGYMTAGGEAPGSYLNDTMMRGLCIGIPLFLIAYFLDYEKAAKYTGLLCLAAAPYVLIVGIWLPATSGNVPGLGYFALPLGLLLPFVIYRMKGRGTAGIMACGAMMLITLISGLSQYGTSTLVILTVTSLAVLIYAWFSGWFGHIGRAVWAVGSGGIVAGLLILIRYGSNWHYFRLRLLTTFYPAYPGYEESGYVTALIRSALSQARFIGSIPEELYTDIPELWSASVLTGMICRWGWISLLILLALTGGILYMGYGIWRSQKSFLGKLLVLAVLMLFGMQVLMNLFYGLGVTLFGEFTFPFFSGNGTMAVNMLLLGVLMGRYRNSSIYMPVCKCDEVTAVQN